MVNNVSYLRTRNKTSNSLQFKLFLWHLNESPDIEWNLDGQGYIVRLDMILTSPFNMMDNLIWPLFINTNPPL